MIRVAWWTCALLALADARVYERCELARELQELGLHPDHISTWVCIAYHESRLDTAAQNNGSGDHGIFQISELYWCGPGKACGQPCSAFRDDDIADDVECALQVHEEHTRLQGDGFLAWVVYPQHCKQNTKKYVIECDSQVKVPDTHSKSRAFYNNDDEYKRNHTSYSQHPAVDNLLPPYLAISSIFRGSYGKVLNHGKYGNRGSTNWLEYKIDNIDELKLPNFDINSESVAATTDTTTTTTTYMPPIKPWRSIETNQFRNRIKLDDKERAKQPASNKDFNYEFEPKTIMAEKNNPPLVPAESNKSSVRTSTYKPLSFGYNFPAFTTTTNRPSFTSRLVTSSTSGKPKTSSTTYRPPTIPTITYEPSTSTTTNRAIAYTTYKPFTRSTTTYIPSRAITTTTNKRSQFSQWTTPTTVNTITLPQRTTPSTVINKDRNQQFTQWTTPNTRATTIKRFFEWTTMKPPTTKATTKLFPQWTTTTPATTRVTTKQYSQWTTPTSITTKRFHQWITPTALTTKATSKQYPHWTTPTLVTTKRFPQWTTSNQPNTTATSKTKHFLTSTTTLSPEQIRQSVFDFYLKPARQSKQFGHV